MPNLEWDDYFMRIAEIVKLQSSCLRRQVGSIFVLNGRMVSTGYNAAPSGIKHCDEIGCLMQDGHCRRALHSENNAILNATLHGQTLVDSILYVTTFPCLQCLSMLRNAKVSTIVYKEDYPYSEIEKILFNELKNHFNWRKFT